MRGFFTKLFGDSSDNVLMELEPMPGQVVTLERKERVGGGSTETLTSSRDAKSTALGRGRMTEPVTAAPDPARTSYYEFNALLDGGRPDNISSRSTNLYMEDLNLVTELGGLQAGAKIIDVGSSYGGGTEGLQQRQEFSNVSFIGVTPVVFERRGTRGPSIPIYEGTAEELPQVLHDKGIGQADAILVRNVMEEIYLGEKDFHAEGLLEDSLRGFYEGLKPGGKVLIYDQYGTGERNIQFYEEYMKKAQELGFNVEELDCPPRSQYKDRICPKYLRLTKA